MFDKATYSKNRKEGKRGQGEKPEAKRTASPGKHMVRTGRGFQLVNREQSRRKLVDRHFTKAGFSYGIKIGSKIFNIFETKHKKANRGKTKLELAKEKSEAHRQKVDEKYPKPQGTNHERHVARRKARDDAKAKSKSVR